MEPIRHPSIRLDEGEWIAIYPRICLRNSVVMVIISMFSFAMTAAWLAFYGAELSWGLAFLTATTLFGAVHLVDVLRTRLMVGDYGLVLRRWFGTRMIPWDSVVDVRVESLPNLGWPVTATVDGILILWNDPTGRSRCARAPFAMGGDSTRTAQRLQAVRAWRASAAGQGAAPDAPQAPMREEGRGTGR